MKKNLSPRHFLIIGVSSSFAIQECITSLTARKHTFDLIEVKNLIFSTENNTFIVKNKDKPLSEYDAVFLHGFHNPLGEMYYLGHYLTSNNIPFLDTSITKNPKIKDKWYQSFIFSTHNIPHPKTIKTRKDTSWKFLKNSLTFPLVIKSLDPHTSDRGRGVHKIHSENEYIQFFSQKKNCDEFLVQEYIPITYDYRVLVLNNSILGCIKRTQNSETFQTNICQGGIATQEKPTKELTELALQVAQVFNSSFCGVDIIKHNDTYFVLEANFGPQWEGFQKATGIRISEYIIDALT